MHLLYNIYWRKNHDQRNERTSQHKWIFMYPLLLVRKGSTERKKFLIIIVVMKNMRRTEKPVLFSTYFYSERASREPFSRLEIVFFVHFLKKTLKILFFYLHHIKYVKSLIHFIFLLICKWFWLLLRFLAAVECFLFSALCCTTGEKDGWTVEYEGSLLCFGWKILAQEDWFFYDRKQRPRTA
jgi:hypothetical protein